MRRLLLVPVAVAATAVALPAFGATQPPDPCMLITTKDASSALGYQPPQAKSKLVSGYRSCTYSVKKESMTVLTRRVATQAAFDKAAKATKGVVFPMQGVGADAYSVNGTKVLVWGKGTEVTITFAGVHPFVSTQQSLAKTAVGRL
jgi:hypothetical protein